MYKKIIVIAVILFNFFIPGLVSAEVTGANSEIPALNPFCWQRADCWEVRKQYLSGDISLIKPSDADRAKLDEGFISDESVAPCFGGGDPGSDQEWGRCLPAGVTKTEINFGGKDEFSHIGDFILVMYKWLVTVASILAVIMIIVSGVQWITSGGNSEAISSAKSRIGGAVIGLFIAYMSYFILNTINPNLVNFRLPQVWLIRPQSLVPNFCKDIPGAKDGKIKFVWYTHFGDQASSVDLNKPDINKTTVYKWGENPDKFHCGDRLLPEGGGNTACFGDICPMSEAGNRRMCGPASLDPGDTLFCVSGQLSIHYFISSDRNFRSTKEGLLGNLPVLNLFYSGKLMPTSWLTMNDKVWGVCEMANGDKYLADNGVGEDWTSLARRPYNTPGITKPYHEYLVYYSDLTDEYWGCERGGQVVGFYLREEARINQSVFEMFKDWFSSQPEKPNFLIGYDNKSGRAVFGTFIEDVILSGQEPINYIPIDKLKNGGLHLEVGLNADKIYRMIDAFKQNPQDMNVKFLKSIGIDAIQENLDNAPDNPREGRNI